MHLYSEATYIYSICSWKKNNHSRKQCLLRNSSNIEWNQQKFVPTFWVLTSAENPLICHMKWLILSIWTLFNYHPSPQTYLDCIAFPLCCYILCKNRSRGKDEHNKLPTRNFFLMFMFKSTLRCCVKIEFTWSFEHNYLALIIQSTEIIQQWIWNILSVMA